jgi:hypothetical protein
VKIVFAHTNKPIGGITMAQSIFVTLDTLATETSVPAINKMVAHTLPRSIFPTSEQFADADKLLQWAKETGCLHACLQKGVQAKLIDARAAFKATKKGAEWTPEQGQKNVDSMTWEAAERPQAAKTPEQKALDALAQLTPAQIAAMFNRFSPEQLTKIVNTMPSDQ